MPSGDILLLRVCEPQRPSHRARTPRRVPWCTDRAPLPPARHHGVVIAPRLESGQLVREPPRFLHALAPHEPEARFLLLSVGAVVCAIERDVRFGERYVVESAGGE
jgi:hypothetical protein